MFPVASSRPEASQPSKAPAEAWLTAGVAGAVLRAETTTPSTPFAGRQEETVRVFHIELVWAHSP